MKHVTNERLLTVCRHPPGAAGVDDQSWMIPSQYSGQGIDTRFADTVGSLRPAILAFKPLIGGVLGPLVRFSFSCDDMVAYLLLQHHGIKIC